MSTSYTVLPASVRLTELSVEDVALSQAENGAITVTALLCWNGEPLTVEVNP